MHTKTRQTQSVIDRWDDSQNQRETFLAKVGYDTGAQLVKCPCPTHEDNTPSAQVNDGCVHCHACGESWSYLEAYRLITGQNHQDAAAALLGEAIGTPLTSTTSTVADTTDKEKMQADREAQKKSDEHAKLQKSKALALEAWHKSKPYDGHELDYFANRGVERPPTHDIRFIDGVNIGAVRWNGPACLIFRRNNIGELVGAECITLNADHTNGLWPNGKSRKQQIGGRHNDGSFLRQKRGNRTVLIGEGTENTLAMGLATGSEVDLFTCFGASNMHNAVEILSCYEVVMIASDNDAAGIKAAQETAALLYDAGVKQVREFRPPHEGEDWNQLLLDPEGGEDDIIAHYQAGGRVIDRIDDDLDTEFANISWMDEITVPTESFDFIEGFLTEGGISVTYAVPNVGKTFFQMDMAFAVANAALNADGYGLWRGEKEVHGGAVVYAACEGHRGSQLRAAAAIKTGKLKKGAPICFYDHGDATLNLGDDGSVDRLIRFCQAVVRKSRHELRMIVVDTLAAASAGIDENSNQMQTIVANCQRIQRELGGLVHINLVHHQGKSAEAGMRGHSSLNGAVDTTILLEKVNVEMIASDTVQERIRATVKKQKDLEIAKPIDSVLRVVELGTCSRGRKITSCVIDAVSFAEETSSSDKGDDAGANKETTAQKLKRGFEALGGNDNVSTKRLAEYLGESESQVKRWIRRGYTYTTKTKAGQVHEVGYEPAAGTGWALAKK